MNKIKYINPEFKTMVESVPTDISRELDLSFDIAYRIEEILKRKGWSQADFARASGKKEAEISKWMSGQHNFTIRTIASIEKILGEKILYIRQFRSTAKKGKQPQIYQSPGSSYSMSILAEDMNKSNK